MVWTDPSPAGALDLANGARVYETWVDALLANLLDLGGTAGYNGGAACYRNAGDKGKRIQMGQATTGVEGTAGTTPEIYSASASVTFAAAFAATPRVQAINVGGGLCGTTYSAVNTTGATIYLWTVITGVVASKAVDWMAIGA